jgi:type II secretory pathway component PulM
MSRATNDEWIRYYEVASRRRRANGGDPLTKYLKRQTTREKRFLFGSSVVMAVLVGVFYSVLMR